MGIDREKEARFKENLPVGGDKTLIILKGHLLIEEVLTEILQECLKLDNPLEIKISDRSNMSSKLNLCWALARKDMIVNIWEPLKKLNNIRNKMAHSIAPKGIDELISEFISVIESDESFIAFVESDSGLEAVITWMWMILDQCLARVRFNVVRKAMGVEPIYVSDVVGR